jgi:hypothetical protein
LTLDFFELLCTTASKLDEPVLAARGGGTASTSPELTRLYDRERELLTTIAESERSVKDKEEEITLIEAQILEFEDSHSTDSFVKRELERLPRRMNEINEEIIAARKLITRNQSALPSINQEILKSTGPFRLSLEYLLQQLNIKRQSYYGGRFVGNDCHEILSNSVAFGGLLKPTKFTSPANNTVTIPADYKLSQQFTTLFNKLYQCHRLYSVARLLCCHEL